ncbi:DUF547 domain-containing protein [Geothermobacter hydrogeniphilus]|uniref:DUF547 domain-containing protein n=1 Tax=Geothermobacter hydrogeniphilus TaxID=1969733 RepID=A0A1X0YA89_9BACT|nr:DUF547 domain-containing protein [Geothermobacter hydrogeniphilus]ORJ62095.1 hypothetical protein B5V00_04915 [Geothermobacter hydrogeniphilus]
MIRCILSLLLILLLPSPSPAAGFDFSPYAEMLNNYLSINRQIHNIPVNTIDYARMDLEQSAKGSTWRKMLADLARFDPTSIADRNQRMAFWINVYNIAAIKTILDHWPVDSIRSSKIHWFGYPWKQEIILVGGREYSLYQIEFEQLVEGFRDLRVHLGINCASASCVDLLPEPFSGEKLDDQLRYQGERLAMQRKKGLAINRETGVVKVSKVFDFDKEHFDRWAGGAVNFLLPYTSTEDRAFLQDGEFELEYLDYDWTVNDSGQAAPRP